MFHNLTLYVVGASSLAENGSLRVYAGSVCELIVGLGVDVNGCNSLGETALMQAAALGHVDIVKWLCSREELKVNQGNEGKATALMKAVEQSGEEHKEVIKILLSHGADPNVQNKWGVTALHLAAFTGNTEATKLLLAHDANKNLIDQHNRNPGFYAQDENCLVADTGKHQYSPELEQLLSV